MSVQLRSAEVLVDVTTLFCFERESISEDLLQFLVDVTNLFCFECEFNEDLLQFLVDVVDAELLEAVLREYLKSVNVENSDVHLFSFQAQCIVYCLQNLIVEIKFTSNDI